MHDTCLCELPRTVDELRTAVSHYSAALDVACKKLACLDKRLSAQEWRDEIWTFATVK